MFVGVHVCGCTNHVKCVSHSVHIMNSTGTCLHMHCVQLYVCVCIHACTYIMVNSYQAHLLNTINMLHPN